MFFVSLNSGDKIDISICIFGVLEIPSKTSLILLAKRKKNLIRLVSHQIENIVLVREL